MKKLIIIITITFCQKNSVFSQSTDDLSLAKNITNSFHIHQESYKFKKEYKNEMVFLADALFVTYKNIFSSQDLINCNFQPSCSVYGMIAVSEIGMIRGMLSTFDRLQRCHSFALDQYPFHSSGLKFDPVQEFEKKKKKKK
jgi:uncharacterized protein